MSSKAELHDKLNAIGYQLGPFAFKDTLSIVLRLHSMAVIDKNINVAKLGDLDLRKSLIRHGLIVGPVTNHTRAVYQRKLLEVLTNQKSEGQEDEFEVVPDNILYSKRVSDAEPMIIRHDYKATSSTSDNTSGMRPRILKNVNKEFTPKKVTFDDELQVTKKSGGSKFLYASITIVVALIVFVLYLLFE